MYKVGFLLFIIFLIFPLFCEDQDIFDRNRVVINRTTDIVKAEGIIENAKREYIANNLIVAKELYTRGLELVAMPEWYYAFGDVLYDLKEFESSRKAYAMAGDFNYIRKDLAYYNAACSACLMEDNYYSFHFLQMALANGYTFWEHMEHDTDLDFIKSTEKYEIILSQYQIPEVLIDYNEDFPKRYFTDNSFWEINIFGNEECELLVYCLIDGINDPLGTYYFCLYEQKDERWQLVNKTIPEHRSTPDLYSNFDDIIQRIDFIDSKAPFALIELDDDSEKEILIPSGGMTYHSAKILDIQDRELCEIGEVEGFEEVYKVNDEIYLVGHQVTDFGYGSGTSEEYFAFSLVDGELEQKNLHESIIEFLMNSKSVEFNNDPSLYNLSSLFWFMYNYDRDSISEEWIYQYIEMMDDSKNKEDFLNVMLYKALRK